MGGTPLPPFTDFFFSEKGVTDLGGTPAPPFTDKIRKVVFEVLPYSATAMIIVPFLNGLKMKDIYIRCYEFTIQLVFTMQILNGLKMRS